MFNSVSRRRFAANRGVLQPMHDARLVTGPTAARSSAWLRNPRATVMSPTGFGPQLFDRHSEPLRGHLDRADELADPVVGRC
ncbi:MAG TPA: hypothetical protein VFS16_11365, partial [Acidimicrobiia bacterium]|nr:hypothetical protein [Acidimicrobiia bacterium]